MELFIIISVKLATTRRTYITLSKIVKTTTSNRWEIKPDSN